MAEPGAVAEPGGCSQLLAELASKYNRSRRFLSELEDSLRAGVAELPEPETPETQPTAQQEGPRPGLRQKLTRFFTRKVATPTPVVANEAVAARHPSLICLSFDTANEHRALEPTRHAAGHAAVPSHARTPLELRRAQFRQEGLEQRSDSISSCSSVRALRRNSTEQSKFPAGLETTLSCKQAASSFSASSSPLPSSVLPPALSAVLPDTAPQQRAQSTVQRQLLEAPLPQPPPLPPQPLQQPCRASGSVHSSVLACRSSFTCAPPPAALPVEDAPLPGHDVATWPARPAAAGHESPNLAASPFVWSQPPLHQQPLPAPVSISPPVSAALPKVARAPLGLGLMQARMPSLRGPSAADSDGAGASAPLDASVTAWGGSLSQHLGTFNITATTAMAGIPRAVLTPGDANDGLCGGGGSSAGNGASSAGALSRMSMASWALSANAAAGVAGPDHSTRSFSSCQLPVQVGTPMRSRSIRAHAGSAAGGHPLASVPAASGATAAAAAARVEAAYGSPGTPAAVGGSDQLRRDCVRLPGKISGWKVAMGAGSTSLRRKSMVEGVCNWHALHAQGVYVLGDGEDVAGGAMLQGGVAHGAPGWGVRGL